MVKSYIFKININTGLLEKEKNHSNTKHFIKVKDMFFDNPDKIIYFHNIPTDEDLLKMGFERVEYNNRNMLVMN